MSTKTIFKRIALTAVSALAAGSLAVISVPAANATGTNGEASAAAQGDFDVITGTGIVGAVTPTVAEDLNGSATRTAVVMTTGTITISTVGVATIKVSAGGYISSATTAGDINAAQNCAADVAAGDSTVVSFTGAAGSTVTITSVEGTACTGTVVNDVLTVTLASASLAGTPSAANSVVRWDSNVAGAPTATEDAANASVATGTTLKLYVGVRDVYDQPVTSAGGALIISASPAGAALGTPAASNAGAPASALSTQVLTTDPSAIWVQVGELTAGAGWTGTVTVSYNGVVLATKSGKITGAVAKIEASALKVGSNSNGAATGNAFGYQAYDAAGNVVVVTATAVTLTSSSVATLVTDAVGTTNNSSSSAGLGSVTCAQGASFNGTTDLVIQTVRSTGTVIKSAPFKFTCGGDATSYTASWDKATYSQGDIATLTVQFRDARGAVANSVGILTDAVTADSAVAANQMERVTALPGTSATANELGQRKFTFTVGTSSGIVAGKYNAVVSFPTVNTRGTTAGVATGNAAAAYEVVAPASISNAEVLASIVKLIAAINKQIRQLQKQLRR